MRWNFNPLPVTEPETRHAASALLDHLDEGGPRNVNPAQAIWPWEDTNSTAELKLDQTEFLQNSVNEK